MLLTLKKAHCTKELRGQQIRTCKESILKAISIRPDFLHTYWEYGGIYSGKEGYFFFSLSLPSSMLTAFLDDFCYLMLHPLKGTAQINKRVLYIPILREMEYF